MRRHSHTTMASGHGEHLGDDMLHLGRMLGRGIDGHAAMLLGHGEADLAFEIEMLLAADQEALLDAMVRLLRAPALDIARA